MDALSGLLRHEVQRSNLNYHIYVILNIIVLARCVYYEMAIGNGDVTSPQNESNKNVLGTTLQLFSKQPLTGFNRDGFCKVSAGDFGNHSVAGKTKGQFDWGCSH
jgi:hypothetical protein